MSASSLSPSPSRSPSAERTKPELPTSLLTLLQSSDWPDENQCLRTALLSPQQRLSELKDIEMRSPALFVKHQPLLRLLQGPLRYMDEAHTSFAGEIHLAQQQEKLALTSFREVQQRITYYLQQRGGALFFVLPRGDARSVPGLLSSQDRTATQAPQTSENWLINRFLVLKDCDSAMIEFNRVWDLLCQKLKTYALSTSKFGPPPTSTIGMPLCQVPTHQSSAIIEPTGFDAYGLHFAQSYASFLNAQRQRIRMIDVLLRAAVALDLDHNPNRPSSRPLAPNETVPAGVPLFSFFETPASARQTRRDFLRFTVGEFEHTNQLPVLMRELFRSSRTKNHAHLTIAFCMSVLNAAPNSVMEMELDYLHNFKTDAVTRAYRAGLIFEAHNMRPAAVAHFELALKSPWTGWPQMPETDDVDHYGLEPSKSRADFVKFVVSKLICLYQDIKGEEHVERMLNLLEWQFEECPELLESFSMLETTEHYFGQYQHADKFARWVRNLPTLGASWRAQGNIALLLGDYDSLTKLLSTAAADGKIEFIEYLRWRNLVLNHQRVTAPEDGFGVVRSSSRNLSCAQALLTAMLKRWPLDEKLLAELQDQQDFCVISK